MSRNFRIFQIFLKNRRIARKHSDTSRTIDRKDRKSGKKRAIRERRPSPRPKQKKRASVRFLVSSLLEDATVCPTVCTTCSTRCDWATRANLPSFAYAVIVEDGSAIPPLPDGFYDRSVWVEQTNGERS